ncbi:MAG: radical SAM protein [Patescibacteria group bacterium]|nr:radical SAM protein [Patescibacteria group bacterium]
MNIALITPPYDLIRKGYGSKKFIKIGFFPPLGVGYLATPLLKKGHKVKIIDCPPLEYQNEDVKRELINFKVDLIGVSSLTASAQEAYSLIKFLKDSFPKVPIIFGGAHVSCFSEIITKEVPMVDCLCYGESETILTKIVDSFEKDGKIDKNIPGTMFKNECGNFVRNSPMMPIMNLDEILPPAYELYDYKIYSPLPLQYKKYPVANVITSRGCPWGRCTFCFSSGKASQIYRRHSPSRVINELKILVNELGIKEVTFWDDNFLINEVWINEFCDLLDRSGLNIPWSACGRVNTVTKSMLERSKRSGLWCVFYGFETGNEDLLLRIKKGATLDQARQAVKWTKNLGIDIRGSFMLALPGETPEKAHKTIRFAKELDVPFAHFLLTFPEWGTKLYDDAIKSGQVVNSYKGRTGVTYIPEGYKDADEVRNMQKEAYRSFYFRPSFIWKHFKRLKSIDIVKQYYKGLKYILGISQ